MIRYGSFVFLNLFTKRTSKVQFACTKYFSSLFEWDKVLELCEEETQNKIKSVIQQNNQLKQKIQELKESIPNINVDFFSKSILNHRQELDSALQALHQLDKELVDLRKLPENQQEMSKIDAEEQESTARFNKFLAETIAETEEVEAMLERIQTLNKKPQEYTVSLV